MFFLEKYLEYNSGNEVPKTFHIWSALALVSAVVNHKIYVNQGYWIHRGTLYILLVGEQGDRKSSAKDIARDILVETFPNIPICGSVTTREAITKFLGSEDSLRSYTNEKGVLVEYHPYVIFINELKNFLSVNPGGMIDFLTDIYDRPFFKVETKNMGTDIIENPSLTILGCETPGWIIRKMKEELITGGFSRRVIMVYVKDQVAPEDYKPRPMPPPNAAVLYSQIQNHLRKINKIVGEFVWTPEGGEFFDDWYRRNKQSLPTDPVMRGYKKTKDVQLLKVCMALAMCCEEPKLELTRPLLEMGLAVLDPLEVNMPRLSVAAGRNELAVPMQRMMDLVESHGGMMQETTLKRELSKDMGPMEILSAIRFLTTDTEQMVRVTRKVGGVDRWFLITRDRAIQDARSKQLGKPPP